jgi:hypothetical protein
MLDDTGKGDDSTVICGLNWVLSHSDTVDIVNMSLGGDSPGDTSCNPEDPNVDTLRQAVCSAATAVAAPVTKTTA